MTIELGSPRPGELGDVTRVLAEWQDDGVPVQLHPGDVGWFWRFGAERTAAATRTWTRAGELLAIGLLDGSDLLRLAFAPHAFRDEELARQVAEDAATPGRGVLPEGKAYVEAPTESLIQSVLPEHGWKTGDPWTLLRRTLTTPTPNPGVRAEAPAPGVDVEAPVPDPGLRVEVTGAERAEEWAAVMRASFEGSTFGGGHWRAMAAGAPFADARCLTMRDERGEAVAVVIVWSAGPGRLGIIEPMGVHHAHRGHGYGRAATHAAAQALQDLGSSSVAVYTPSSNIGAVATYRSAGLELASERRDLFRDA